jgi:hypothetical protein
MAEGVFEGGIQIMNENVGEGPPHNFAHSQHLLWFKIPGADHTPRSATICATAQCNTPLPAPTSKREHARCYCLEELPSSLKLMTI